MAKIVSALNQKGGIGKTTMSVHLATMMKELHPALTIVIADADPLQSAKAWIEKSAGMTGVHVQPVALDGEGKCLKAELNSIKADLIILDLPPAVGSVIMRGALYADLILVPVGPSELDVEAARFSVTLCKEAVQRDPEKRFLLVPNRVQLSTTSGRDLRTVLEKFGPVSEATLCLRVAYADSVMHGVGVNFYAPGSPAFQEMGLLAEQVSRMLDQKGRSERQRQTPGMKDFEKLSVTVPPELFDQIEDLSRRRRKSQEPHTHSAIVREALKQFFQVTHN